MFGYPDDVLLALEVAFLEDPYRFLPVRGHIFQPLEVFESHFVDFFFLGLVVLVHKGLLQI